MRWIPVRRTQVAKVFVSLGALALLLLRVLAPELRIDAASLGLFVLAALPWSSERIKSAQLPGGMGVKLREVKDAGDKLMEGAGPRAESGTDPLSAHPGNPDPNLALVGLRIDIERRLRTLADRKGLQGTQPLSSLVEGLRGLGMLDEPADHGLRALIAAGDRAAHWARVEPGVRDWTIAHGPRILRLLDAKLKGHAPPEHE